MQYSTNVNGYELNQQPQLQPGHIPFPEPSAPAENAAVDSQQIRLMEGQGKTNYGT